MKATKEEEETWDKLMVKEQQHLLDAARKIHVNTGHRTPTELAKHLREHNAPPASRAAMEKVKCDSCLENKRPEAAPVKETNVGKVKDKWLVIVDEATRLCRAIWLFDVPAKKFRNAKTKEIMFAFMQGWEEIFGLPRKLRHDPEGAFQSNQFL